MKTSSKIEIGKITPWVVAMAFLFDFTFRFIPVEWISFRGWEALTRYPAVGAPFQPNAAFQKSRSCGDLPLMGNLPQYRDIRSEQVSTDQFGFRRNGPMEGKNLQPPKIILTGDSFSISSGVRDDSLTLASQIEKFSGIGTYNGAGILPNIHHILTLSKKLHISSGTVIYQYVERNDLPSLNELVKKRKFDARGKSVWEDSLRFWKEKLGVLYNGFIQVSPLQILAQRAFRKIQNDDILPNSFSSKIKVEHLIDETPMLFYSFDVENFKRGRNLDTSGWEKLAEELKKNNLEVIFVLVPDKYTVYRPLLQNPPPEPPLSDLYLNRLERKCLEAGLQVINLTGPLREKAREEMREGQLIYFSDDTHWNARGIEFSARKILERFDP